MGQFNSKVIAITGAANGIGRAAALAFSNEGAKVIVADIDSVGIQQTTDLIHKSAGDAIAIKVDVANEEDCQNMVDEAISNYGQLDVLFNNAAISGERALTGDMTTEAWQEVINVNLNGVFYCTRAALPVMQNNGGGVIINTSSVDGLVGMASISHYVAAKHAVMGLTKTTALEYASQNIRCVAVAPGYVHTNMTEQAFTEAEKQMFTAMIPQGRPASPAEIANVVVWLASDSASYINGSAHVIDGGLLSGFGNT